MTNALPMILPQPITNRTNRKPSGQKTPLRPKEVWAIRVRLQLAGRIRDLALFNLAIDSKLRGCDLVRLKVADIAQMGEARSRASVIQRKTGAPILPDIPVVLVRVLDLISNEFAGAGYQPFTLFNILDPARYIDAARRRSMDRQPAFVEHPVGYRRRLGGLRALSCWSR